MKVAIFGDTSNIVDLDSQIKLSKEDTIITNSYNPFIIDGSESDVAFYVEKWAKEHNIPVIEMYFKAWVYKGDFEGDYWNSRIAWYKDIVKHSDKIVVYCDEDYSYSELHWFAIGYALYLDKQVEVIKLKPMQHFTFSIGYEDERHAECFFSIRLDKDIPREVAKGMAIEQAKKKFSDYTKQHPYHNCSYGHSCELCILEGSILKGRYWKTVENN